MRHIVQRRAFRRQQPRYRSILEFLSVSSQFVLPSSPPVRRFYRGDNYSDAGGDASPDCFVPMLWGKRGQLEQLPKLFSDGNLPRNLLVYNEPDLDTQANRTVQEVVREWSVVTSYSTRISAPNVAKINSKWLTQFMSEASHLSLKVDFLGVHWYGGANARQFLALIDKLYEQYGLPIWITEFAVADWKSSKYGMPNQFTEQDVMRFLKVVLPELERRSYVERFAWLAARTNKESLRPSALFDESGRLTKVGELYANFEGSELCVLQQQEPDLSKLSPVGNKQTAKGLDK